MRCLVLMLYIYLYDRHNNYNDFTRYGILHISTTMMIGWTTLIPALIILGIAFILMNLGLLIKSRPLEKRCQDGDCECSCGD